jgi:hypothetical protein
MTAAGRAGEFSEQRNPDQQFNEWQSPSLPFNDLDHFQFCQILIRLVRHFNKKCLAVWQKHAASSYFFIKSSTFLIFPVIFLTLTSETKTELFSNFNSFIMFPCPNIFGTKFRYFCATFG